MDTPANRAIIIINSYFLDSWRSDSFEEWVNTLDSVDGAHTTLSTRGFPNCFLAGDLNLKLPANIHLISGDTNGEVGKQQPRIS